MTFIMEYDLNLVGLQVKLQTLMPIQIADRLGPFLCPPRQADCTIAVRCVDKLPDMAPAGVWNGPEYYDCRDGDMRIFHTTSQEQPPFALTVLTRAGNVELLVLPGYESYFSGTSGIFNRIGMESLLLQHSGLLLHASLVKYGGVTVAFAGPSGVGKSTQAELWQQVLGAQVLNGDRAALRKEENGWVAYGSPYAGTSGIYCNDSAPLAAIVLPEKAGENCLKKVHPVEAFGCLYPELTVHRWDKYFAEKATDLCLDLTRQVPVYRLACLPEPSAVELLKEGLQL